MTHTLTKSAAWCAIGIAALSALVHLRIGLNNDTMTLLHQTGKMLAGGTPYIDYIDVNPPLVNVLFSLPLFLAHATGMKLYHALNLFALAVTAISLGVSFAILRAGETRLGLRAITLGALGVALLSVSFMHQLFADREWLVVTLVSPLLLLYSPLAERARVPAHWRNVAAVMAALGFALKPYTLPLYFMALGYRLLTERPSPTLLREPEHYIIGTLGIVYIAVVLIFFREYFFTFLPIASDTYGVIGWNWDSKMTIIGYQLFGAYAVVALAATFLLVMISPAHYDRTITYLGFLLAGSVASYTMSAGWYYTQYPFMVVALLMGIAAGSSLIAACTAVNPPVARRFLLLFACAGLLGGGWHYYARPVLSQVSWDLDLMKQVGRPLNASAMAPPVWAKIETHLETRPRFLLIGINLWAPSFLVEGGKSESVGRFDYLWPLPGIVMLQQNRQRQGEYEKLAKWFSDSLAEDIEKHHPAMVINDVSPYQRMLPDSYNALGLLGENPRFARAWEDYALADTVDECTGGVRANCAYQVYYKK